MPGSATPSRKASASSNMGRLRARWRRVAQRELGGQRDDGAEPAEARAATIEQLQGDAATLALDEGLDRVHADATARDLTDLVCRGEAGLEDQRRDLLRLQGFIATDQALGDGTFMDAIQRQAASVVLQHQAQRLVIEFEVQFDATLCGLADAQAMLGGLDAVVERIAVEVDEDIAQHAGDLAVHRDAVIPHQHQRCLLAKVAGEFGQGVDHAGQHLVDALGAQATHQGCGGLHAGQQGLGLVLCAGMFERAQQFLHLDLGHHQETLDIAAPAGAAAAQLGLVDAGVLGQGLLGEEQFAIQALGVPFKPALTQVVVGLLDVVNRGGQRQQTVGPRIALYGVHIAEHDRHRLGPPGWRRAGCLGQQGGIGGNKAVRTLDELVELLLLDAQDLADDGQLASLGLRRACQRTQFGHVAQAEQDAADLAGTVGHHRPVQVEDLLLSAGECFLDLGGQQMGIELEVHFVLAEAGREGRIHLRQGVGAQAAACEHQLYDGAVGDVLGLEDGLEMLGKLRVHEASGLDGQDALRDAMQHGVDIRGLLAYLLAALLDLLNHCVEGDHGLTDLVVAADRQAVREVLAGRDLGHLGLHLADGPDDLTVEQPADRGERQQGHDADRGERGLRTGLARVQRGNGLVLAAVLLDLQRLHDLAFLAQVLVDVGGHHGFGHVALALGRELGDIIDGFEIVRQALLDLLDQPLLGLAVGLLGLLRQ
mmetsp:Transcript_53303/g.125256  ORF Transcript_53303/g.125256 Transcript_53303/m.125256 type:complete len:710 (+) Transcript_53303:1650-3779(+)